MTDGGKDSKDDGSKKNGGVATAAIYQAWALEHRLHSAATCSGV